MPFATRFRVGFSGLHARAPAAWVVALAVAGAGCSDERSVPLVSDAVAVVPAEPAIEPAALAARFLDDTTAVVRGAPVQFHPGTAPFYRTRAFAPAWTSPSARDSMVAALRAAEDEGIRPGDVGRDRLDSIVARGIVNDSARVDRELLLTDGYFRLADALLGRRIEVRELYPSDWYPVPRKAPVGELLQEALEVQNSGSAIARVLDRLRPRHPEYAALRAALARARRDDGLPVIEPSDLLVPGDTSELITVLRRRLARTRDWTSANPPDSLAQIFDPALVAALRRYQVRHGLDPTGELDAETRASLNTPGRQIEPLLALNLERWRWLPDTLGDRHVWVNIPTYELDLRSRAGRGWRKERTMNVVIGQAGRWRTPVFSDTITQVVFNPTWTIPRSIQLESYGRVDPRGMVRQPGPSNPLGRVKFVFPNPYGIYLHDTNAPRRLQWEYRALSHGCVRLGDPRGLADDLLATSGWDTTRVAAQFRGRWIMEPVDLQHPVPIHLVYLTAEPAPNGAIYVVPDVYGWDRRLARALGYDDGQLTAARAVARERPRRGD